MKKFYCFHTKKYDVTLTLNKTKGFSSKSVERYSLNGPNNSINLADVFGLKGFVFMIILHSILEVEYGELSFSELSALAI